MRAPSHKTYLLLAALLLLIEIAIALFVHDRFVRPFVGDFLVIILLYCLLRGASKLSVNASCAAVFLLAVAIETAQAFHLDQQLGLSRSPLASVVIGSVFDGGDIAMYAAAVIFILLVEYRFVKHAGVRKR